ncbi:hypothetical protein OV208_06145 [Corallococcus sp. bb12-1]|uniref:hypothetical protein n=1 Tax=Corallococcus sp. bb12-1 TaxID=2996784 RepID=UPI002271469A|nr:hypothetical protein [Corallococcus sp. bb12-1]MCY1040899.1 hypothetical protein [Corallococcus sp. bb12-1]
MTNDLDELLEEVSDEASFLRSVRALTASTAKPQLPSRTAAKDLPVTHVPHEPST